MQPLLPKLPPGADVVFRRLFDEENGCRLLISLLNGILRFPSGALIRKLTIRSPHLSGPLADDKEVILDVRAEAEDGRHFHVEVQICAKPPMPSACSSTGPRCTPASWRPARAMPI